jgi:hypothetical protein
MRLRLCEAELLDLTVSSPTPCSDGTTETAQLFGRREWPAVPEFLQSAQGERPLPTLDVLLP